MTLKHVWALTIAVVAARAAQLGDGRPLRAIADFEYEKGTTAMDVLWATLANDQRYPNTFQPFLDAGRHALSLTARSRSASPPATTDSPGRSATRRGPRPRC